MQNDRRRRDDPADHARRQHRWTLLGVLVGAIGVVIALLALVFGSGGEFWRSLSSLGSGNPRAAEPGKPDLPDPRLTGGAGLSPVLVGTTALVIALPSPMVVVSIVRETVRVVERVESPRRERAGTPKPTFDTLRLVNGCKKSSLQVAIHYTRIDGDLATTGWWVLRPGGDAYPGIKSLGRYVYFYAVAQTGEREIVWSGDDRDAPHKKVLYLTNDRFSYGGDFVPPLANRRKVTFFGTDTGKDYGIKEYRFGCDGAE